MKKTLLSLSARLSLMLVCCTMAKRSCLVVLIGATTSGRKWINYEIEKAYELNKGIVVIYIHGLKDKNGNLDSKTSDEVIALLKMTAKKYGQTIVMITHDDEIAQVADRILVIEDGQVVDFR